MYETIKRYYELGLYTAAEVQEFVTYGWITQEQYNTIVNP